VTPFHWEIEFPEVFDRENPGFDCFAGNPPFLGGVSTMFGDHYRDWLASSTEAANSNADLVSHFFRRSFDHIRQAGCIGLIATNTIAQGDTREVSLQWICLHGGEIYEAHKRIRWPGAAAVVVSVVHAQKGRYHGERRLNATVVPRISAYLFHAGGDLPPTPLASNTRLGFVGCDIKGLGFTFDDSKRFSNPAGDNAATYQEKQPQLIDSHALHRRRRAQFIANACASAMHDVL
jgi:hypothetical protein